MNKRIIIVCALICLITTSCIKKEYVRYSDNTYVLGTFVSIDIFSNEDIDEEVFDTIFNRLRDIEQKMTINKEDSEIQKVNLNAGKDFVEVSEDTMYVINTGLDYTKLTDSRFDISVGPLVKLWNIGFENENVPSQEEIEKSLKLIDASSIELDESNNLVKLEKEGMIIDLGGIAKGYATDEVVQILREYGFESAIINLGGNIFCYGSKPDGNDYKIGIRDPFKSSSDYMGVVQLSNRSVVTSGVYERNFTESGKIYHHILDTETGFPVDNNLEAVSIIADKSINADALSTGVFSMGLEEGFNFIENIENVEAIFVTSQKEVYVTSGGKSFFELTEPSYEMKDFIN